MEVRAGVGPAAPAGTEAPAATGPALRREIEVVLLSTYDLGRQPLGLASAVPWLREAGASVTCLDVAVEPLGEEPVAAADLIAFHLPMHTATRMAARLIPRVRRINPGAHLCAYGVYAPLNAGYLRRLGAQTILGGEFEEDLASLAAALAGASGSPARESVGPGARRRFRVPDRAALPGLQKYAHLHATNGELLRVGHAEATRGCKHLCRHCPIVPAYEGRFLAVPREVVLADIEQQVRAGARHITFGDPDFFNGPGHAERLVRALHERWPRLTYDVTIKIEHLLRHADSLPLLRDTGCLFVTSAVEAVQDDVLEILHKGHTRDDFVEVAGRFRKVGLTLNPTFVTFTPWTTLEGYSDLLELISRLDLVQNVSPVQYAIRLLITARSRLLELPRVRALLGDFDEEALCFPWRHPDPRMDRLHDRVRDLVSKRASGDVNREEVFSRVWRLVQETLHHGDGAEDRDRNGPPTFRPQVTIPYLTEPWYC